MIFSLEVTPIYSYTFVLSVLDFKKAFEGAKSHINCMSSCSYSTYYMPRTTSVLVLRDTKINTHYPQKAYGF